MDGPGRQGCGDCRLGTDPARRCSRRWRECRRWNRGELQRSHRRQHLGADQLRRGNGFADRRHAGPPAGAGQRHRGRPHGQRFPDLLSASCTCTAAGAGAHVFLSHGLWSHGLECADGQRTGESDRADDGHPESGQRHFQWPGRKHHARRHRFCQRGRAAGGLCELQLWHGHAIAGQHPGQYRQLFHALRRRPGQGLLH